MDISLFVSSGDTDTVQYRRHGQGVPQRVPQQRLHRWSALRVSVPGQAANSGTKTILPRHFLNFVLFLLLKWLQNRPGVVIMLLLKKFDNDMRPCNTICVK